MSNYKQHTQNKPGILFLRLRLDWAETQRVCVWVFPSFFFFPCVCETYGYCSFTVQWTVAANFDFSKFFGPITAHRVLFTDPQISLFSNFFIKNGSHDTIQTFKNYFATVFFSFQFQFSALSKRTLNAISDKYHCKGRMVSTWYKIWTIGHHNIITIIPLELKNK